MRLGVVLLVLVLDYNSTVLDRGPELRDAVRRRHKVAAAMPGPRLVFRGAAMQKTGCQ